MYAFSFKAKRILLAVFCLALLWQLAQASGASLKKDDKAEAAKRELDELQGTWKILTHEENGREYSYGDNYQLYTIEKNKITVTKREGVLCEGTIEIDATKSPKQLDVKLTSGQTDLLIYFRVNDYWIQCGHRDGETRPTEFASGTPKGGAYLLILKREK